MKGLLELLKEQVGLVVMTVCVSILSVTASFAWNVKIADLIDDICEGHALSADRIGFMCMLVLAVAVTEGGFMLLSGFTAERMSLELRESFAIRIQSKDSSELAKMNVGVQISKLLNEVNEISEYLTESLFPLINKRTFFPIIHVSDPILHTNTVAHFYRWKYDACWNHEHWCSLFVFKYVYQHYWFLNEHARFCWDI